MANTDGYLLNYAEHEVAGRWRTLTEIPRDTPFEECDAKLRGKGYEPYGSPAMRNGQFVAEYWKPYARNIGWYRLNLHKYSD